MCRQKLLIDHPSLMKEWHIEKNKDLEPERLTLSSNKQAWWQCEKGHEWRAIIHSRSRDNGNNCPYCSGRYPIVGETDLATTHPDLAKEWHPIKNKNLTPQKISRGHSRKVWWQCAKGHEWEASPYHRQRGINHCPYCSDRKLMIGENDLLTKRPHLAEEFHPSKNGELTPSQIKWNASMELWWVGKCGHEWKTRLSNRVFNNSGCPYCSGTYLLKGFNDLETKSPNLSKEFHPTKNGEKLASDYQANSGKSIWWKCEEGHEWKASIYARTKGNGCPYCSGRLAIAGVNDLATTHPSMLNQWHFTKNKNISPQQVSAGSSRKVWWICEKGHESLTSVANRVKSKGCPYCSGKKLLKGFNDLETLRPDLAKEWHPTKNGELTPADLMSSVAKKVWWQCEEGHEWMTSPNNRPLGRSCPYCVGHRVIPGKTDLKTLHPDVAKEWHPTKNGVYLPEETAAKTHEKRWFVCEKGHEYEMPVHARTRPGARCPYCSNKRVLAGFNDFATIFPHLVQEWHHEKNEGRLPSQFTYGSGAKIWWQCKKGHEWRASIDSRRGGSGCPVCSESRGEAKVAGWLSNQSNLTFVRQYRFKDCCYRNELPFDFAVFKSAKLISLIEYDGEQHFRPIEIFGGEAEFESLKIRDGIKDKYCLKENIPLLRIPYFDFKNIDKILENYFETI